MGGYWRNERVVVRSAARVPGSIDNAMQLRVMLMLSSVVSDEKRGYTVAESPREVA